MFLKFRDSLKSSQGTSLAKTYTRLGWAGFWLQVVLGSIPVLLMAYYFLFSRAASVNRSGLPFVEYLTIASFVILLFTMFWSLRYTRLGKKMLDPKTQPPEAKLISIIWTGVLASTLGMLLSMVIMLLEAGNLLFNFLKTPQAGVPVIQTTSAESISWVSAVDMVSLVALILMLLAELIVLVFSLWLLFRTMFHTPATQKAT
jgi:hypothetical protein